MFPGKVVQARLVESPSQISRTVVETRLELMGPAPVQLPPPNALGAVLVEATPAELAALTAAGYTLKRE